MRIEELVEKLLEKGIRVGYVYPDEGSAYYIHSNLRTSTCIEVDDGYLYAETDLREE